jgi:hypothetical protein
LPWGAADELHELVVEVGTVAETCHLTDHIGGKVSLFEQELLRFLYTQTGSPCLEVDAFSGREIHVKHFFGRS